MSTYGVFDRAVPNRLEADGKNKNSIARITPTIPTISRIEPTV
jgi:hypothetical protein